MFECIFNVIHKLSYISFKVIITPISKLIEDNIWEIWGFQDTLTTPLTTQYYIHKII